MGADIVNLANVLSTQTAAIAPDAQAKQVLKEAVDAVVNSFAKHTQGYGRGKFRFIFSILSAFCCCYRPIDSLLSVRCIFFFRSFAVVSLLPIFRSVQSVFCLFLFCFNNNFFFVRSSIYHQSLLITIP